MSQPNQSNQVSDVGTKYLVPFRAIDESAVDELLQTFNYRLEDVVNVGRLYAKENCPAILIDTTLYSLSLQTYQYVDYTSYQNRLMHKHQGLYRFVWDNLSSLENDLNTFLLNEEENLELRRFGADRSQSHIDPTPPEFNFSVFYEEVFGTKAMHALEAESQYVDCNGHARYIDFKLNRIGRPIAIELNGESYHHPLFIKPKQYRSQLYKQNSLVYDNYLVYRWSDRGMADRSKFADQMCDYFGEQNLFLASPKYRAERSVSFELYKHQEQAVEQLNKDRKTGKDTFLVVLPMGTGKTEVFIEDVKQQFQKNAVKRVLAIVPSTELKKQLKSRLNAQLNNLHVGHDPQDKSLDVVIQTSAYMVRHYVKYGSDEFDYILVDEAHRAAAHGLRKVLEHFNPKTLLGLTATDERLDQQKLEDIFGRYEVDLTLEQAIEQNLIPPMRAFRLESNIDFSQVRFNGKDFVKSDLNKSVLIPSRNQLIVDVISQYFTKPLIDNELPKQGVVFCVDIKHTKAMAKLLNEHGIKAAAVDGKNRAGIEAYKKGDVQYLCACDLLNEGWDAPQTSVVVMARPTMSKVLYMQQLGRGTRKFDGKEALYVIDVVDSYGAALQPWSVHGLFNLSQYQAFADVIQTKKETPNSELMILEGLHEEPIRIEPINIFNFEKEYGDLLNDEQLARELFVSTGTIKSWLKKGEISADKTLPFGNKTLNFYHKEQVTLIRKNKKLKERTEDSRKDDFFEFLEERDYTFSYKLIFLLAFINNCNDRGEIELDKLTTIYQKFYLDTLEKYDKADKEKSPYNRIEFLKDTKALQSNLLANPFEKFERKRFVYHCKDLNIISFDTVLWEKLTKDCFERINKQYKDDLINYYQKIGISNLEIKF
ncbi:MAG: DEAD/DEAH box helicase [Thalassotalea sp.]|nr:DEAD/DEAH box helicase [Thalassotalea sp.]